MYCRIVNNLDTACMEHNILELWKFNKYKIQQLNEPKIIKALNRTTISPVFGHPTNYIKLLGDIKKNETGHVVGASALLSLFMVHVDYSQINYDENGNTAGTADMATKTVLTWEEQFMKVMENFTKNAKDMEVFYESGRSFADISASAMFQDVDKLFGGIVMMFIFIQIVISKFNWVECRILLGSLGLGCIGLAFVVACGFCSLIGISYGPVHTALPFLLMGIGVDDMFVIMACWKNLNQASNQLSLPEKMGRTLKHAGASITITTATDVAAFLVGSLTILPSLQSFCLYAAAGVFMTYIFQVTIFVACFVYDEKRIEKNRNCMIVCHKHNNYKPNTCGEIEIGRRIIHFLYSKIIFTTPGKMFVILLTLGLAGIGIKGNLSLRQKFDPNWFLAESTHLYKFRMETAKYFPGFGFDSGIYFGRLNYSTELPNIHRFVTQFKKEKVIVKDLEEWSSAFRYFVNKTLSKDISTDILSDEEFSMALSKFLFLPSGSKYQKLFRFDGILKCGQPAPPIRVSGFEFNFGLFDGPEEALPAMNKVKQLLRDMNVTTGDRVAMVWGKVLANWVTDEVIDTELYRNLALACFCVMLCTVVLIINVVACFFVFLCVLLTLISVGGFMYFWGLTIDTVSCIGLQLATGLCVDYASHICHTFLSRTGTKSERILDSVTDMAPAVLCGGVSTVLAVSVLAGSESHVFKSFFKIFLLVVIFGQFHGVVFLPVVLSLLGPEPYAIAEKTEREAQAVKMYNLCDAEPPKQDSITEPS
ncbi:hypothetical protein C0J52_02764 [Blattella germanica]|nr:hypothetical protein C0J52_02764 [Blattella germanica]